VRRMQANPLREGLRLERTPPPCALVIFGATGDLTKRKLVPALYALSVQGLLPNGFTVVGAGRTDLGDEAFRAALREAAARYGRLPVTDVQWDAFAEGIRYARIELNDPEGLIPLRSVLEEVDLERGTVGNRVYYLSIPPSGIATVARRLGEAGMSTPPGPGGFVRLIVEKPFGRDLATRADASTRSCTASSTSRRSTGSTTTWARRRCRTCTSSARQRHLRAGVESAEYIDHVQITVAESIGVEGRGRLLRGVGGALRDIVQNHIMQLVALGGHGGAGELPSRDGARREVKLLRAIRPIHPDDALEMTVRGQYGPGGSRVSASPATARTPASRPPRCARTFVALKLDIDNWRWAGTPFYLRTGKCLPRRTTEVAIQFRRVPQLALRRPGRNPVGARGAGLDRPQPAGAADPARRGHHPALQRQGAGPGDGASAASTWTSSTAAPSSTQSPEAYERLLVDCMLGDATLFAREDEVEEAWRCAPRCSTAGAPTPRARTSSPTTRRGTWGPQAAHDLLAATAGPCGDR